MANKYPTIQVAVRNEFGKGAARRSRVAGLIPTVIYGGELEENIHVLIDHQQFTGIVRNQGVNAVVEVDAEGEKVLTMIKHIDQNVLTFRIDHLDLLAIKRGEKVEVEVPLVIEGESAPGTMATQSVDSIRIEADVLDIPEEITVSIEGLEFGTQLTAAEIAIGNATLVDDPELLIVNIVYPETENEEPAAAEDADSEEAKESSEASE